MSENEAEHVVGGDADDGMSVLTVRLPVTVLPVIRADTLNDAKAIDEIAVGVAEEARVVFLRQVERARREYPETVQQSPVMRVEQEEHHDSDH